MGKILNVLHIKPGQKLLNLRLLLFLLVVFVGEKKNLYCMEEAHNTIFLPSLLSAIIMDQTPLTFSASFCCFCHGHSSSWATLQCEIVIRLGIHCCAPALQPPSLFALPNKLRDTAADSQSGQFIY